MNAANALQKYQERRPAASVAGGYDQDLIDD